MFISLYKIVLLKVQRPVCEVSVLNYTEGLLNFSHAVEVKVVVK